MKPFLDWAFRVLQDPTYKTITNTSRSLLHDTTVRFDVNTPTHPNMTMAKYRNERYASAFATHHHYSFIASNGLLSREVQVGFHANVWSKGRCNLEQVAVKLRPEAEQRVVNTVPNNLCGGMWRRAEYPRRIREQRGRSRGVPIDIPRDYINTVAEQDARTEEGDFAVTEELLREESLEIIAVPVDEVHAEINNLREEH